MPRKFSRRVFQYHFPTFLRCQNPIGPSNVARPISPDLARRCSQMAERRPKLADVARRSLAALSVVETTLWSCNVWFMHMPRFTYDTTHYQCKRVTVDEKHNTPSRWKSNEGSQLPCCFDTPRDSLNIARIMHRISLFLTVLRLAQFRNSRYYGERESIKFVLLFEIMVENNGKLDFLLSLFKKK